MLAVDKDSFADVAWFRDDFARDPLPELVAALDNPGSPEGIPLPDNARSLGVLLKSDRPHPSVAVMARVRDDNGRYLTYPLGRLTTSTWRLLEAELFEANRFRRDLFPARPMTLVSISIFETDVERQLQTGSILIDSIRVRRATGEVENIDAFRDIDGWNVMRESPQAFPDRILPSEVSARGDGSLMFAWAEGSPRVSRGIFHGPTPQPVPVLVSPSFLKSTGESIGDEIEVSIGGHRIPLLLADTVDYFPTVDTINDNILIADLTSLIRYANLGTTSSEIKPNELWLSTNVNGTKISDLVQQLRDDGPFPSGEISDRAQLLAENQLDPLVKAGWRALLFIAFAAILILSSMGFLVHAYVSFRNREVQFALMRTMGFSMKQLVALMWLEQALVIAVGMALGSWMGGRLAATIMPFLGNDDRGVQILPPFAIEISWGSLAITYIAMAGLFTLIIAGVILIVRKMSLSRVLRMGDG